jgi:hypothetical protein
MRCVGIEGATRQASSADAARGAKRARNIASAR